jgi:hypothetical protein
MDGGVLVLLTMFDLSLSHRSGQRTGRVNAGLSKEPSQDIGQSKKPDCPGLFVFPYSLPHLPRGKTLHTEPLLKGCAGCHLGASYSLCAFIKDVQDAIRLVTFCLYLPMHLFSLRLSLSLLVSTASHGEPLALASESFP